MWGLGLRGALVGGSIFFAFVAAWVLPLLSGAVDWVWKRPFFFKLGRSSHFLRVLVHMRMEARLSGRNLERGAGHFWLACEGYRSPDEELVCLGRSAFCCEPEPLLGMEIVCGLEQQ